MDRMITQKFRDKLHIEIQHYGGGGECRIKFMSMDDITLALDGVDTSEFEIIFSGDDEWHAFTDAFLTLARELHDNTHNR